MRRSALLGEQWAEDLEYARPAEPPEPLPHAVPVAELGRQSPPYDVVHREIVECFRELTVVVPGLSTGGLRHIEYFERQRPVRFGHSR